MAYYPMVMFNVQKKPEARLYMITHTWWCPWILLGLPDMDVGEVNPISSWNVDPNEPRYCLCNDVSYGEMVGCDNEDVSNFFFSGNCIPFLYLVD